MHGEMGKMTDRNCLHPGRIFSGSLTAWRIREDIRSFVEIVNLWQHRVTTALAPPPVVCDEFVRESADGAGARKRMLNREITAVSLWSHHCSLNRQLNVHGVADAFDQPLQISH